MAGKSAIDRKIQALQRRKQHIAGKILDVAKGDEDKNIKKKKIEAMNMEIQLIELEISRLKQKKADLAKGKPVLFRYESDQLPPSLSDLIHPDPRDKERNGQPDLYALLNHSLQLDLKI